MRGQVARGLAALGVVVALACVLAACHSGQGATSQPAAATSTHRSPTLSRAALAHGPRPVGYDPPLGFARRAVTVPRSGRHSVALAGIDAYVATGTTLRVVNTRTGVTVATVRPRHPVAHPATAGTVAPPLTTTVNGRRVVAVGYVVRLGGRGAASPVLGVEVDLVAARSHRLVRTVTTPLVSAAPGNLAGRPAVSVVGVSGDVAAVVVGDGQDGYVTEAVNLDSQKRLWHSRTFLGVALAGAAMVGTLDPDPTVTGALGNASRYDQLHLAGVSLSTGHIRWQSHGSMSGEGVWPSGPRAVIVAEQYTKPKAHHSLWLIDAATGHHIADLSGDDVLGVGLSCRYDGRATDVCSGGYGRDHVTVGVDAATGKELWRLPDKAIERAAPTVTAVWHGAVYGTTPAGPAVLDARNGNVRNHAPGLAPILVDAYVGVVPVTGARLGLAAHPADHGPNQTGLPPRTPRRGR